MISTHTINLQEQLLHKDIPILKKILPIEFEAALMKGPAELSLSAPSRARACNRPASCSPPRKRPSWRGIADWARTTKDGSLSDLADRARPESLDAGLQRSAHLHGQDVRPEARIVSSSRRANACSPRT